MKITLSKDIIFLTFDFIIDDIYEIDIDEYFDFYDVDSLCSDSPIEDKALTNIYSLIDDYKQTYYFKLNRTDLLDTIEELGNCDSFSYDVLFKAKKEILEVFDLINKKKNREDFFKTHFVKYCQCFLTLCERVGLISQKKEIVKIIYHLCYINRIVIYTKYPGKFFNALHFKLDELLTDKNIVNDFEMKTLLQAYKEGLSEESIKAELV
jgi:hypothetical protein